MTVSIGQALHYLVPTLQHAAGAVFAQVGQFHHAMMCAGQHEQPAAEPEAPVERFTPLTAAAGVKPSMGRQGQNIYAQVSNLACGQSLTLGRDPAQSQILCSALTTSRNHASIGRDSNNAIWLSNISGRPTAIERDGKTIAVNVGTPQTLNVGDRVRLGGPQGEAVSLVDPRQSVQGQASQVAFKTRPGEAPAQPAVSAERRAAFHDQINTLTPGASLTMGRDAGKAKFVCTNPNVGGDHASILRDHAGGLRLWNSSGLLTSIERGGKPVDTLHKGEFARLQPGDVIRLGGAAGETFTVPAPPLKIAPLKIAPARFFATPSVAPPAEGRDISRELTELGRGRTLTFGRDARQSGVVCTASGVGSAHASIKQAMDRSAALYNLSGGDTAVIRGGETIKVLAHTPIKLEGGDTIRLGGVNGESFAVPHFLMARRTEVASTGPAQVTEGAPVSRAPVCGTPVSGTPVSGALAARIAQLRPQADGFLVGRSPETTGVVVDAPTVSGQQARIYRGQNGKLMVSDLKSTNGTAIERGGECIPVERGAPQELKPGDLLRLGGKTGPAYAM